MAQNITAEAKRQAVVQLVLDAVAGRIAALRTACDAHWVQVTQELFDVGFITNMNDVVDVAVNNMNVTKLIFGLDYYGSYNNPVVSQTNTLHPWQRPDVDNDPFGMVSTMSFTSMNYEQRKALMKQLGEVWNSSGSLQYVLPIAMKYISETTIEDANACNLSNDTSEKKWTFDITDVIPTDCTTQRKFSHIAKQIGEDADALYTSLMSTIRLCRTDSAVIKAVPELDQYINPTVSQEQTKSLLLQAING